MDEPRSRHSALTQCSSRARHRTRPVLGIRAPRNWFWGPRGKFPSRIRHTKISWAQDNILARANRERRCGLTVAVKGTAGESIELIGIDPKGIVHVATAKIPATGAVEVAL
jgi:hypothetical protein